MVYRDYQVLIKRVFFSFLLFAIYRVVFYFYNYNYFEPFNIGETVFAYFYGFRFDLSITLITNLIFILFSLLPITNLKYRLFLKTLFVLFNTIFLGFLVVDLEFFTFLGKKMTFDLFDMGGDIKNQLPQIIKNYWYLASLVFINMIILWKLYPRRKKELLYEAPLSYFKVISIGLILFLLTAIGVRGGLQLRSISPKEAFIHKSYELGNLSLNAAYSMVRSIGNKGLPRETYFSSDMGAKEKILQSKTFKLNHPFGKQNQNIIILILESFSQEYLDLGYAPFLSELAAESLYLDHNFANGRRSIEVLPSIMTALPSIIGKPIYQSQYQSNNFYALPKILKDNNYQTAFYHGGKRGTMDFDAYCLSIGFDKYFALEDYPDQSHFDGHWGVYDSYYLKYFLNEMDKYQEPFFTSLFTLSSHQPYSIPSLYKSKFPKGKLEIHESIGYVDYSLKEFFSNARDKKWFNNTLFVITADHTQKLESHLYNTELGRYRVPLLFYHPQINLKEKAMRSISQHADILSSIVDFLGIDLDKKLLYGNSLFSNSDYSILNAISGNYFYIKNKKLLRFDKNNAELFGLDEKFLGLNPNSSLELKEEMLNELKAYIQYTNNGLKNNSLYK